MTTLVQAVNEGIKYVNGCQLAWGSNTTLTVAAGQARNSDNSIDINLDSGVTIDFTVNGLNGLDTGSIGASHTYGIFLVYDYARPSSAGCIASLSLTSPFLPAGYGIIKLIGYAFSDGSSHLKKFYTAGEGSYRQYHWDTSIQVLDNGTATSLTAIDLTGAVPAVTNTPVVITAEYTPATANDSVSFAPYGSTATVLPYLTGSVAAKKNTGQFKILSKLNSTLPEILYINSASSGNTDVYVNGFDFWI